ncbi:MAG TPA: M1 family metallopeptidase, partial [Chitinophagales bacterium]|nr:M1 family metallopeptidase [Chitinophagales bacterium]
MKIFFTATLFSFLLVLQALAQTTPAWQQKVDYKIEVGLDDTLHELNGFITINYQNNSPDTLTYIYFHLWPNAYKDQTTPLAKQMLENGKTSFWYSKPSQRGYLDKIDFKQNAETCRWEYTLADGEICKLFLNQPLAHGESVNITTPFHVKLPETFSRMGHIGQSYQITQWYPKPAVYDKYGWHAFPYIDQGEFYSEFGSFDVSITLPKNYVVGATGDLQDTAEISWMNKKADEATAMGNWTNGGLMSFPPSDKETKTLHYKQQNIHDFGWFADKRYHVLKGEVTLPYTQRKVTTWALFTNNQARYWSKAPEYLHDAIQYYSLWIGEYPYNQVTAVDGTISAGSGMEYPNVTVIGEERSDFSLDDVITHEVGHNWFYGMLGSNERDHAWMDEGINSYYEYRYIRTKYPNQKMLGSLPEVFQKFLDVSQYKHKYLMDLGYQLMARENTGQPIELTSSKFTDVNYGLQVYGKSMLIFSYLEAYLGTEVFDKVMKKYFITWQYHHPQPEDVRSAFETETGKNLSWFFDGLLNTTKTIDYKIACVDK